VDTQTYLFFDGRCEEALSFYAQAIRAETLFMMRFKDGPAELARAGREDKIFHATMRIGTTLINLNDDSKHEKGRFGGFALLLHADSEADAEQLFARLADGGVVQIPLQKTMWASLYGIITDKFGVVWKVQSSNGKGATAAR
jgi:PhnB protein